MTNAAPEQERGTQEGAQEQPIVNLERIYVKDVSFESPKAPHIFALSWQPHATVTLNTGSTQLDETHFEVWLKVVVKTSMEGTNLPKDQVAYLVDVTQAGVFTLSGFDATTLTRLLATYCPHLLLPYVRETLSDLIARGTFPQFLLNPINFDLLFEETIRRQQQQQSQKMQEAERAQLEETAQAS
jgi:preprotein translocase subunit SecB